MSPVSLAKSLTTFARSSQEPNERPRPRRVVCPVSLEAKDTTLSNGGASQRLMRKIRKNFLIQMTTQVGMKRGGDPGSNPGQGVRFLF